ncbi:MAG TPA: hypothetical protein PLW09_03965 [Candidatus Kapabacteria bacterium]|nr:hypothetical protein [Candidatus Kapabacteria bacterium]
MKLLFNIFFFCIMTLPCLAQDSLKTASTLSFKPLVGLGLLNGARGGLQIQYNDIIAIEGGVGIFVLSFHALLTHDFKNVYWQPSHGIIVTPLEDKRLSFYQYTTYSRFSLSTTDEWRSYIQVGVGWSISMGKSSNLRISTGFFAESPLLSLIVGLDCTLLFDGIKIPL